MSLKSTVNERSAGARERLFRVLAEGETEAGKNILRRLCAETPLPMDITLLSSFSGGGGVTKVEGEEIAKREQGQNDDVTIPGEFLLVPNGSVQTTAGTKYCNARTVAELPNNQAAMAPVLLDVPSPYGGGGTACSGAVDTTSGNGITFINISWTADGRGAIGDGYKLVPSVWFDPKDGSILYVEAVNLVKGGGEIQARPWPASVKLTPTQLSAGLSARDRMILALHANNRQQAGIVRLAARPASQVTPLSAEAPTPTRTGPRGAARMAAAFERENARNKGR